MKLWGWGRYPIHEARVRAPRSEAALREMVAEGQAIARGNGRSYGDSAISKSNTIHMGHFNRLLAFDNNSGVLVAESGVMLSDIIQTFLPRGWFPYVTPGTKFVTVGGLIAADVHGKNHHKDGGFGNFIEWLDLMDGDGVIRRCSRDQNTELFKWTIGGMGLTGVILKAAFRLRKIETAWIRQTIMAARSLNHAMDIFEEQSQASYSVAWIDCLSRGARMGRSLIMLGEHAKKDEIDVEHRQHPLEAPLRNKRSVPVALPGWILNRYTVSAFNSLYYRNGLRKVGEAVVDWDTYFYPLDSLQGWNKIYGRRGFVQFQCVIPSDNARTGLNALLKAISDQGTGSFLAVLKKLGSSSDGISFPLEGFTLALDFSLTHKTFELLPELERITIDHGGHFYLAKDASLTADTLNAADRRVADFRRMRQHTNVHQAFQSAQSQRLAI